MSLFIDEGVIKDVKRALKNHVIAHPEFANTCQQLIDSVPKSQTDQLAFEKANYLSICDVWTVITEKYREKEEQVRLLIKLAQGGWILTITSFEDNHDNGTRTYVLGPFAFSNSYEIRPESEIGKLQQVISILDREL